MENKNKNYGIQNLQHNEVPNRSGLLSPKEWKKQNPTAITHDEIERGYAEYVSTKFAEWINQYDFYQPLNNKGEWLNVHTSEIIQSTAELYKLFTSQNTGHGK